MRNMKRTRTYSLAGKVVFLTGAGGGLGTATAATLTQRGARVVLADALIAESLRRGKAAARHAGEADADQPETESDNGHGHDKAASGDNEPAERRKSKGDRRWR